MLRVFLSSYGIIFFTVMQVNALDSSFTFTLSRKQHEHALLDKPATHFQFKTMRHNDEMRKQVLLTSTATALSITQLSVLLA